MKIGEAALAIEDGEIRNYLETVVLGPHHEVVVPSLVRVDDGAISPLFDLRAERSLLEPRRVRILAHCVADPCRSDQLFLSDERHASLATNFFRPWRGRQLDNTELPAIFPHQFGLLQYTGMNVAKTLVEELRSDKTIGRVVRRQTK